MIKINKPFTQIPPSLRIPPIIQEAKTTHRIRLTVINEGQYPSSSNNTNKRYRLSDIKEALYVIYNGKCAYCEQKVEFYHVEHFRPKSIYYWLAFAWSNLLYACYWCNNNKSDHFEVEGDRAIFNSARIYQINTISLRYDDTERPKLINPERENPEMFFIFQKDGLITSSNTRALYTIKICNIDREYLNDERKKIWDKLVKDIKREITEGITKGDVKRDVDVLLRKFRNDSQDLELSFLAFRRYAVKHFLTDLLNQVLNPTA